MNVKHNERMLKYTDVVGGEHAREYLKAELSVRGHCPLYCTRDMNLGPLKDLLKDHEKGRIQDIHQDKPPLVLAGHKKLAETYFEQLKAGDLFAPKKKSKQPPAGSSGGKRKSSGGKGKGSNRQKRCRY